MGILRCAEVAEIENIDNTQLVQKYKESNIIVEPTSSRHVLVQALKSAYNLKLWHDHGKIAGHGHLLVLVSCIFDEVYFHRNVREGETD